MTNESHSDLTVARSEGSRLTTASLERCYCFGPFVFYPQRQLVFDGDTPVRLGSRASAILEALIDNAGIFLTNDELTHVAWPTTHVEEGNLRVHISALRRALNDSSLDPIYISNAVGRGYRFIAPVQTASPIAAKAVAPPSSETLPAPLVHIIGRDEAISTLEQLLTDWRLVSVVGAGGMGKTTVALAAAHRVKSRFRNGAYFIDLAAVTDAAMVPFAVASALRASIETDRPLASLIDLLRNSELLILLDNCEHLISAAAELVDALLRGSSGLRVLATSHEPLRSQGERVLRLPPFDVPDDVGAMTLEQASRYPAVELFIDRAGSDQMSWAFSDLDVPFIVEICRRLDGIPLAIEMAASRAEVLGVGDLAARLDDRFELLTGGKRTAVARQQTIRSMLDWSHENLSQAEKSVLRRLGVFAGSFSLGAAHLVVGDESLSPFMVTDSVASLAQKSLISFGPAAGKVTYRLLESVRLYALERLKATAELPRIRKLHAQYLLDMLQTATDRWMLTPRAEWLALYSGVLDDVRSALAWAFSESGDANTGVLLTSLAMPLGLQLGLVDEFRSHIEKAIERARLLSPSERVAEMRLNLVYGILNQNQIHPNSASAMGLERAFQLAEEIGDDRYRIEPQILMAVYTMSMGNYPTALKHAKIANALSVATGDDIALVASRRVLAQVTHFSGNHAEAVDHAEMVLRHPIVNIPVAFGSVQTDRRVSMRIVLARARWLQGLADEAVAIANEAIAIAPEDGPLALCQAMALGAGPVLLWRGDHEAAAQVATTLMEQASRYTLRHWHSWGLLFEAVLKERGGVPNVVATPQGGLQLETLATFIGRIDDTVLSTDLEASWSAPELIRLMGEKELGRGARRRLQLAEDLFLRSQALARRHGALAWELRGAMSLARLWRHSGRRAEAIDLLGEVHARFTQGHASADLVAAASLMTEMIEQ